MPGALHRALARLDAALTTGEVWLCLAAATSLGASMSLWVALKGLAAATSDANQAGLVFRALASALVLGLLARRAPERFRRPATLAAIAVGLGSSWLWRGVGLQWAGNLLNWLQDSSALTLMGGLRGVGTRLTLVLALTGGALATSLGRHVTIDVLTRALPSRARRPLALLGGALAGAVCLACAWGFVDFIAVDTFRAPAAAPAAQRFGAVTAGTGRHFFLLRRQVVLDLKSLPVVLGGGAWDSALDAASWNAWLEAGAWSDWYSPEQVSSLRETNPGSTRAPLVATPGEAPRGLLAKSFNLVVPVGLLWLALRFLLWCLRGAPVEESEPESRGPRSRAQRFGVPAALVGVPGLVTVAGGLSAGAVALGALLGTPLFAVMGGASLLGWWSQGMPLRHVAPRVLDEQFAGSPVLVTIPLFTLLGYVLAEGKAPDRIVTAARAFLGWLPGGLAVVCLVASAFFTTLTGGSGVTIVAIGGLLLPTLSQQRYPERFSLGLVTSGGSLGLLFPPSLAILVYALVAGLDFATAFKAGLIPGLLVLVVLSAYSVFVGVKERTPREAPTLASMRSALWLIKWELGIPVLILATMGTGLAGLDESAALAAVYVIAVELLVHRDLKLKADAARIVKQALALSGAVILILLMANALMNFVIQQHVPERVLGALTSMGLTERWQFLVALNLFLLVVGMVMDGFSAIIVAVPLVLPFAARFGLHPFHLAMMFILNLELAFCAPPLGLNLFIASFRFRRPLSSLYRSTLPFVGLLGLCLVVVMAVPWLSTVLVQGDVDAARADAAKRGEAPREAWKLQCVQEDPSSPKPCTDEDRARWAPDAGAADDAEDDALYQQMMNAADGGS